MALIVNNILFHGLSGKLGMLVFRQCHGRTILSMAPARSKKPLTPAQIHHRTVFKEAIAYAKTILTIPGKEAELRLTLKRHQTVFNAAVAEYIRLKKSQLTT